VDLHFFFVRLVAGNHFSKVRSLLVQTLMKPIIYE